MEKNISKSKKVFSILLSFIMAFVFINHVSTPTTTNAASKLMSDISENAFTVSSAVNSVYSKNMFYSKSYFPVYTSGKIYAKDTFAFTVNKNGKITLHSVYQSSCGYPSKGWQVTYHGGSYIKVNTYWGSNSAKEITIKYNNKSKKISTPVFKTVTCHYTIYSNGTVKLDKKS